MDMCKISKNIKRTQRPTTETSDVIKSLTRCRQRRWQRSHMLLSILSQPALMCSTLRYVQQQPVPYINTRTYIQTLLCVRTSVCLYGTCVRVCVRVVFLWCHRRYWKYMCTYISTYVCTAGYVPTYVERESRWKWNEIANNETVRWRSDTKCFILF